MTAPGGSGLLDFFVLEAGECLAQLDGLLARAEPGGPAADALLKDARRLRGSATMAKLAGFAEVAAAIERVARALREQTLAWDDAVRLALVGAVDDLAVLLHRVRAWGDDEEAKARARTAELDRFAPAVPRAAPQPAVSALGSSFLALEAEELAMGIAGVRARPTDAAHRDNVAQRVRRLRGIAALKDLPPMSELVEGIERALRAADQAGGVLGEVVQEVLASATDVLARAAVSLRAGDRPATVSAEIMRFAGAMAAWESEAVDGPRVVPVSTLFYEDDGPHILERAAEPPSTPHQRFRLEVVSLAEHLRRLVADARAAADIVARDRVARELRSAVRTLMNHAESFAEASVASFALRSLDGVTRLDSGHLAQVDEVATLLSTLGGDPISRISAILNAPPPDAPFLRPPTPPAYTRLVPAPAAAVPAIPLPSDTTLRSSVPARVSTPVRAMTPVRSSTPVTVAAVTPPRASAIDAADRAEGGLHGEVLHDLLGQGIAGLGQLALAPMSTPTPVEDDSIVPIEDLEYRGRAALDRAIEIRDAVKARNGPPSGDELEELFALLDLVGAE